MPIRTSRTSSAWCGQWLLYWTAQLWNLSLPKGRDWKLEASGHTLVYLNHSNGKWVGLPICQRECDLSAEKTLVLLDFGALGSIEWTETFCQKDQLPLAVSPRHFPFPRLLGFFLTLQIKTLIFLFSNVCYVATKMYLWASGISGIQMELHPWCDDEQSRTGSICSLRWMDLNPVAADFCIHWTSMDSNNIFLWCTKH